MKITGAISTSSLITKMALRIKAEINNAFQESGANITSEQWGVLKCLWRKEGISQSEIAEKVNKDKASVTRILDIMQKNKLITRCDDEHDRRSYRIYLTEEGKNLENKLKPVVQATIQRIYQNLDECELEVLQKLLLKLVKNGDDQ
ncbi:MAG TPA: MarR family transcriptional regulator [Methylomusa anaerophila]|uniref:Organic hydroperoxide resistance transcriptional regulator n=1 Tax=Methylomusa anaerophila TaxID=1930071 RepID=A0A348AI50_9FIRM|nr:MarR family transcriptional regulator [Methylomusa anaerophila]BBB90748.1 organic hydroperoxide resistance transcriptional regulator [Methylomusa anaerophila]HML88649.1 MarR family transcriptional regulator [Methylomusa anaerophila]